MTQIKRIRLRSITAESTFETDIPFGPGLNIIQADNTSGKSTTLMSVVYCLGLERFLGPKLDVPFAYAMREEIETEKGSHIKLPVLESYAQLELENPQGESLTIKRSIVGSEDRKLVRTWNSPLSEVDAGVAEQRDFFLHDGGAATRELGFHFSLAKFLGWELPQVPRFDGDDCPLYIETLFPLFFVEQKRGWSTVQGPFPTFLGIQDMARRVMEFILDLDAGKVRRRRSELRKELQLQAARFRELRKEVIEGKGRLVRIEGLPNEPTAGFGQSGEAMLSIYSEGEWTPLETVVSQVQKRIDEFDESELVALDDAEDGLRTSLKTEEEKLAQSEAELQILRQEYELAKSERDAFRDRVTTLEVDLLRNQDALKLKKLGSALGEAVGQEQCPTCQQSVSVELLPPVSREAMGLDENIAFIRSQLELYRSMLGTASDTVDRLIVRYEGVRAALQEVRSSIRSLKNDLVRPAKSSARSELEEILRLEARLERWLEQQENLDGALDSLRTIAREWAATKSELSDLGNGSLTTNDRTKVTSLQTAMQKLLEQFHFDSFQPDQITLSDDDFRPQVMSEAEDGSFVQKDLGFEASASDGIRLKWSYLLALQKLAQQFATNHIGFAVFDEPGQQQMRDLDLASFFAQSATAGGQVIVTTSEQLQRVRKAVEGLPAQIHEFSGYILSRVE